MDKKRSVTAVIIIYTSLITILSVVKFSQEIEPIDIPMLDKFVHFCFYFGLNTLFILGILIFKSRPMLRQMIIATFVATLYGISIEYIQLYVGRDFDLYDILANTMGAVTSLVLFNNSAFQGAVERILGLYNRK